MKKRGGVSVSAAELRARVNDLADRLTGRLEETADRIRAETLDRAVRRRALFLKADAIPAFYTAADRADPLAAAVDVWGLTLQITQYLENGAGRDAFGPQQPLAREGARNLLADTDAVLRSIATSPTAFDKARADVERWAKSHPIEVTFSSRSSIAPLLAEWRSEDRDAFVAVGEVSDTIENVSERLNTYAAQLPRQARWQAELMLSDMAGERDVQATLGDIHDLGSAGRRVDDFLADVPSLLGSSDSPLRGLVAEERRALLQEVNGQRLQTLEYATAERRALLAALSEERFAVVAALHQERIETLKEMDAIRIRAMDSAVASLRDLVDYTLWRVAALLLLLMFSATSLGVVAYWLTVKRRYTAATS
jgi:hypothetical protein